MSQQPHLPLPSRPNRPWIDIATIRNALNRNHFIDLLSTLTAHHSYKPDTALSTYNPANVYALRMRTLSSEYRRQVTFALAKALPPDYITSIDAGPQEHSSTLQAISNESPLIVGAVLADNSLRIRVRVPFLMLIDLANNLFPFRIPPSRAMYIAIGVKRRPLETDGLFLRDKCLPRVQAELCLWNRLLAATQGVDVGCALLIGLNPRRKRPIALGAAIPSENDSVFDSDTWSIARVPSSECACKTALEALRWRVQVVDEGEQWVRNAEAIGHDKGLFALALNTDDIRMRPNMKSASMYDWPWACAKRYMAVQLCELTLVSGVSQKVAAEAMRRGLPNNFSDERVTAKSLGVDSHFTAVTLQKCKPSYDGLPVTPAIIPHNRFNWRALQNFNAKQFQQFDKNGLSLPCAEERSFYVDFELASPEYLCSRFNQEDGGRLGPGMLDLCPSTPFQEDVTSEAVIFMIGCGQVINGIWKHQVFTADGISRIDESAVVRRWLEHMDVMRPKDFGNPILFVWGPEQQLLRKALRRMTPHDAEAVKEIKNYNVVNMLHVASTACLSIKGALNNTVKSVATALEELGMLDDFEGRPRVSCVQDGADAMALALDSVEHMRRSGLKVLADAPNMDLVASYNEADCRDIARIVAHLRKNH